METLIGIPRAATIFFSIMCCALFMFRNFTIMIIVNETKYSHLWASGVINKILLVLSKMSYLVQLASQRLIGCRLIATTSHVINAISSRSIGNLEDFLDLKVETKEGATYVEARPVSTGRENKIINIDSSACVLCRLNLKNLDYTDVKILSQFIKCDGSVATFHESKLCSRQYNIVTQLIKKAQRCNLIPRPADYFVPGAWHELNTYLESDRRRDQPMKVIKKEYWKL